MKVECVGTDKFETHRRTKSELIKKFQWSDDGTLWLRRAQRPSRQSEERVRKLKTLLCIEATSLEGTQGELWWVAMSPRARCFFIPTGHTFSFPFEPSEMTTPSKSGLRTSAQTHRETTFKRIVRHSMSFRPAAESSSMSVHFLCVLVARSCQAPPAQRFLPPVPAVPLLNSVE